MKTNILADFPVYISVPLGANPTKWPNTLADELFEGAYYFVGLAFKGLIT